MMVKPTFLDSLVAKFSPQAAAERLAGRLRYEALSGGYIGAGRKKRRTWRGGDGSADAVSIPDLPALRARSRDHARNTPIGAGAINRAMTLAIGNGLSVEPQIDRELLGLGDEEADRRERDIAREFDLFSRTCDLSGVQNLGGLQGLAGRGVLEAGDVFMLRRMKPRNGIVYETCFQFYEADQVDNPGGQADGTAVADGNRIVGGIEIDADGVPVKAHVLKEHPGNIGGRANREAVPIPFVGDSGRWRMRHLYDRKRIGQTRGIPYLAPVIDLIDGLGDFSRAEIAAAVIGSMITVVYKSKSGEPMPNVQPESGLSDPSVDANRQYRMEPGTVLEIDYEDDVEVPNVGRPNQQFDPFFKAVVRQIGSALGIPFEVLIMHFTASYSASRAAVEMAYHFVRQFRGWLVIAMLEPVYEAFFDEAVAIGRIKAPGYFTDPAIRRAWLGAAWSGPGRIVIDPKKEAEGYEVKRKYGWQTDGQITGELTGGNWEKNIETRGREERTRKAAGLAVETSPAGERRSPPDDDDGQQDRQEDERQDP